VSRFESSHSPAIDSFFARTMILEYSLISLRGKVPL
jgi:hypothetical protein